VVVGLAVGGLLLGGVVGTMVRVLAEPDVSVPETTAADGTRAQRKFLDLARAQRPGQTVFTEPELNALLTRHVVETRGVKLASPVLQLVGDDRLIVHAQSPVRHLLDETRLGALADAVPKRWQTRLVRLRIGARIRVEGSPRRQLRVHVDEFSVGRQRLPVPALRLLLDPAAVGLLQWPLPEHVDGVTIEQGRVVVQTSSR
jgi:hypothetical protein